MTVLTLTVVVDDDVPSAVTDRDVVEAVQALRGVVRVAASVDEVVRRGGGSALAGLTTKTLANGRRQFVHPTTGRPMRAGWQSLGRRWVVYEVSNDGQPIGWNTRMEFKSWKAVESWRRGLALVSAGRKGDL